MAYQQDRQAVRQVIKRTIKLSFRLMIYPIYLWFSLLTLLLNEDRTFATFSQFFSLIPGKLGTYCRASFYCLTCPGTSDDIVVGFLTVLSHRNTTIERGVYIGSQCNIGKCYIRKNTLIGSGVHILSGNKQHKISDTTRPIQEQGGTFRKIEINKNCWIGNCAILQVDLPSDCVVSAGAIITKNYKSGDIIIGSAGKVLRNRHSPNRSEIKSD